jgi:hypothetical protein
MLLSNDLELVLLLHYSLHLGQFCCYVTDDIGMDNVEMWIPSIIY